MKKRMNFVPIHAVGRIFKTKALFGVGVVYWMLMVVASANCTEREMVLKRTGGEIHGSIIEPETDVDKSIVVLIVCGSGPTDRNGNNPQLKNNAIKYLAEDLGKAGIPSVRYDKRAIGASAGAAVSESELRFSTYVEDAKAWVELLAKTYRKVVLVGHSEGALIAVLAAKENPNVSGVVSIAGTALPAGVLLKTQLAEQPQTVKDLAFPIIDSLEKGKTIDQVPPLLNALFRKSVQPYLVSWFAVNPTVEIARITCPVLILQGDKDIQVSVGDAEQLHRAQPKSKKIIIPNMNHVFKECFTTDKNKQLSTYGTPGLPNIPQLSREVVRFVRGE